MSHRCNHMIEGPKYGRRVVAWRRQCANVTYDPSGYCYLHRRRHERLPDQGDDHS